jgi:hypothetical protein
MSIVAASLYVINRLHNAIGHGMMPQDGLPASVLTARTERVGALHPEEFTADTERVIPLSRKIADDTTLRDRLTAPGPDRSAWANSVTGTSPRSTSPTCSSRSPSRSWTTVSWPASGGLRIPHRIGLQAMSSRACKGEQKPVLGELTGGFTHGRHHRLGSIGPKERGLSSRPRCRWSKHPVGHRAPFVIPVDSRRKRGEGESGTVRHEWFHSM